MAKYSTSQNKRLEVGMLFLNIFEREKNQIFQFLLRAHLAYKRNPIKIYKEWSNLNTVKVSFCKVAVPFFKFAIKDIKMTKNHKKMATLPLFSTLLHKRRGLTQENKCCSWKWKCVAHKKVQCHFQQLWFFCRFTKLIRQVREPTPLVIFREANVGGILFYKHRF